MNEPFLYGNDFANIVIKLHNIYTINLKIKDISIFFEDKLAIKSDIVNDFLKYYSVPQISNRLGNIDITTVNETAYNMYDNDIGLFYLFFHFYIHRLSQIDRAFFNIGTEKYNEERHMRIASLFIPNLTVDEGGMFPQYVVKMPGNFSQVFRPRLHVDVLIHASKIIELKPNFDIRTTLQKVIEKDTIFGVLFYIQIAYSIYKQVIYPGDFSP